MTPFVDRRARLATLRVQLAQLERQVGHGAAACLSLGAHELHAHLPTPGLAGGVLHEVFGATHADRPAAFGFVVALMASGDARRWTRDGAARDPLSPPPSGHPQGEPHPGDPEGDGERDGVRGSQGLQPLHVGSARRLGSTPSRMPLLESVSLAAAPHPNPLPARAGRGDLVGAPTIRLVSDPQGPISTGPAFLVTSHRALADFGRPYGRGLGQAGLDPSRLVLIETRSDKDALWALEEVLSSDARPSVVAGIIETPLGLTGSRRLNLAAARCGTPLLVLGAPSKTGGQTGTGAAATRWRIAAAPAGRDRFRAFAQTRWRVALERCRHGRPGEWLIEWDHAAYCFRLAPGVADRAPAAGARLLRRTA